MKRQTLWLFAAGQICFLVGLIICIVIKPEGLGINQGISYYGTFGATFVPYAFALLGSGILSLIVARRIMQSELWPLRFGLMFFALFAAIITFTPFSAGTFMDWAHTIAGIILFSMQLALSFWLIAKLRYRFWPVIFAALELAAGIVAAVYVLPKNGILIQSQIVFQLAFGALIICSLNSEYKELSI